MHLLRQRVIALVEDQVIELVRKALRQHGERALGQRTALEWMSWSAVLKVMAPMLRQAARRVRFQAALRRVSSPRLHPGDGDSQVPVM